MTATTITIELDEADRKRIDELIQWLKISQPVKVTPSHPWVPYQPTYPLYPQVWCRTGSTEYRDVDTTTYN